MRSYSILIVWAVRLSVISDCAAQTSTPPPLLARPVQPTPAVVVIPFDKAAKDMLSCPTPEYPVEARARHLSGRGVFELEVLPETGEVSSVTVVSSTGYPILDHSAIKALRRWRFRPHTAPNRVKLPITFSYKKDSS